MDRIVMRPVGVTPKAACWHCGAEITNEAGTHAARYIYRGDQPLTAVVEDWVRCACGAYQNVRALNEIFVEELGK
jgi:hypothetical protein